MTVTRRVGVADSGATVTLSPGEELEIRLPETPTTGYRWQMEPLQGLAAVVRDTFELAGSAPGAGGARVFVVSPLARGEADVRLTLRRSREREDMAVRRFTITLVVA